MAANDWEWLRIDENGREWMGIDANGWECMRLDGNECEWIGRDKNGSKYPNSLFSLGI